MKKILFILMLAIAAIYPQQKGSMKVDFDGEEIVIPFSFVDIRKDDKIVVTARGEVNDSAVSRFVTFEFTFESLQKDPVGVKLQIKSERKMESAGKELYILYGWKPDDEVIVRMSKSRGGEKITWDATRISAKFNLDEKKYENGQFIIKGNFSVELETIYDGMVKGTSSNLQKTKIADLKNGTIEIIF